MSKLPSVWEFVSDYEQRYHKRPTDTALRIIEQMTQLGTKLEQIGRQNALDGCGPFQAADFQRMTQRLADAGGANHQKCAEAITEYLRVCYMDGYNGA